VIHHRHVDSDAQQKWNVRRNTLHLPVEWHKRPEPNREELIIHYRPYLQSYQRANTTTNQQIYDCWVYVFSRVSEESVLHNVSS
jgi:hypothetical protein